MLMDQLKKAFVIAPKPVRLRSWTIKLAHVERSGPNLSEHMRNIACRVHPGNVSCLQKALKARVHVQRRTLRLLNQKPAPSPKTDIEHKDQPAAHEIALLHIVISNVPKWEKD